MKKISYERMQPIRDVVYLKLRKAILRGNYKPGERLHEEHLSEQLGTSRTPVREALRKLEVEKMVTYYPHRGVVVSDIDTSAVKDLYEIRKLVDVMIARRAAENATEEDVSRLSAILDKEEAASDISEILDCIDDFNVALTEMADCPSIADICLRTRETLGRIILFGHTRPERRESAQKEHREIVDAIANHNVDLAEKLTVKHLNNASQTVGSHFFGANADKDSSKSSSGMLLGEAF